MFLDEYTIGVSHDIRLIPTSHFLKVVGLKGESASTDVGVAFHKLIEDGEDGFWIGDSPSQKPFYVLHSRFHARYHLLYLQMFHHHLGLGTMFHLIADSVAGKVVLYSTGHLYQYCREDE